MPSPALALLHGYLGFTRCGPVEYFRDVEQALRRTGVIPIIPQAPPAGTVAERAEALARQLFRNDAATFALVAHSMGGLDARHLITHLDPDRRIKSLFTVATPHHGTPLATWFLESRGPLPAGIRYIGRRGLGELTPVARAATPIPDRTDVAYSSYAGYRPIAEFPFWFRPYARIIQEDNDGMVPVSSAQWGNFHGIMRTDHLEFIGWSLGLPDSRIGRPFNHLVFWLQAAAEAMIAAQGETN